MAKNVTLLHSFFCIFRSICLFLFLVFCGPNYQNWLKPWFFVSVTVYHNLSKKRPKCRIWSTLLFSPTPTKYQIFKICYFIHTLLLRIHLWNSTLEASKLHLTGLLSEKHISFQETHIANIKYWKKWFHHTHYFQVLKTFIKQSNVVHFEILLFFYFRGGETNEYSPLKKCCRLLDASRYIYTTKSFSWVDWLHIFVSCLAIIGVIFHEIQYSYAETFTQLWPWQFITLWCALITSFRLSKHLFLMVGTVKYIFNIVT